MLHCTACSAYCLRPACAAPGDVGTDVTTGTSACRTRTGTVGRRQRIPIAGQCHSRYCPSQVTARIPRQTTGSSTKTKRCIQCSRWQHQLNASCSLNYYFDLMCDPHVKQFIYILLNETSKQTGPNKSSAPSAKI